MTTLVAVLGLTVAALYAVIAIDVVPRVARVVGESSGLIVAARWGAFAFLMGCAATHVGIAVEVLGGSGGAMGGASTTDLAVEHVLPHVAQVVGGITFITIAHRHLDIRLSSKTVASRLQQLEAQFRASFERSPIGMALLATGEGEVGRFLQVNAALADMVGADVELLRGGHYTDLGHPAHRDAMQANLVGLAAAGPTGDPGGAVELENEQRLQHRDGRDVWAQVRASVVPADEQGRTYLLVQLRDVTVQRHDAARLRELADHDPLTGTLNRRRFDEELQRLLSLNERYGDDAALLVIDLDQFKYINDTHGHPVGDALLRQVTSTLRSRLRDADVLARLGGDEFGVLCCHTGLAGATALARDLLEAVRREAQLRVGDRTVRITASIGLAMIGDGADEPAYVSGETADSVDDGTPAGATQRRAVAAATRRPRARLTADALLASADFAMYESKESGRDRITVVDAGTPRTGPRRRHLAWAERVHDALEDDGLVLWEQPILNLATGRLDSSELLVRMRDPSGGPLLLPGAFLPAAEQFGQMQAIDRWVFTQAVQVLARRQAAGSTSTLEVNLSGASVTDEALMGDLVDLIRAAPIDPTKLMVEITETAAIGNLDDAFDLASTLRSLGCRFALDDFGSGFGSFAYLKHLPFDCVKIDGDFVQKLATSRSDQLTVQAIVQICRGLGKQTIAEYVSDDVTLALLRGFGVDHAQGFHVAPPRPVDDDADQAHALLAPARETGLPAS